MRKHISALRKRWQLQILGLLKQLLPQKKSIVFTWLLSYVLMLMIPVFITSITYIITVQIIRNEINNSNQILLGRIQQQIDSSISEVDRLSQEIAANPNINRLLRLQNPAARPKQYQLYEYVQDLRAYQIINKSVEDFFIYFQKIDFVLSPTIGADGRSFYDSNYQGSELSYIEWKRMVSRYYKGNFTAIESRVGESGREVSFIRSIPLVYNGGNFANILIKLNGSRLLEGGRDIETLNHGSLIILSRNNEILFSSSPLPENESLNYARLERRGEIARTRFNGRKAVLSYIDSQLIDWKYIIVVPESVYWEKAQYIRNLAFLALLFCLLFGGLVAYVSMKRNYNPIEQLVRLLETRQGMSFDQQDNEYSFIQQSINKAFGELEKVDGILILQNKLLHDQFIVSLLKGEHDSIIPLSERMQLHDIKFQSAHFAVLAFYIDDFGDLTSAAAGLPDGADPLTEFKKAQIIIANAVEGQLGTARGYMVEIDNMLICLVNFAPRASSGGKRELARIAEEAARFVSGQYNLHFLVAASNVHKTITGIPIAYNEALQAMEYKRLLGIEEVIHYEDIQVMPKGDYYYPLEKEYQLINLIKIGDEEKAKAILEEILEKNFQQSSLLPIKVARCLMFNLVSTMIKTVNEVSGAGYKDFIEEMNPVEALLGCESITEMRTKMLEILDTFCDFVKARSKARSKIGDQQLVEEVKQYITANYTDANLAITAIADSFKTHPVYLSKIFRDLIGEGLLDFINRIRIQKAKQLFKETDDSLENVARAVGYFSTRTFTRAFKKYEGVTPGRYKESGT